MFHELIVDVADIMGWALAYILCAYLIIKGMIDKE